LEASREEATALLRLSPQEGRLTHEGAEGREEAVGGGGEQAARPPALPLAPPPERAGVPTAAGGPRYATMVRVNALLAAASQHCWAAEEASTRTERRRLFASAAELLQAALTGASA
jgi:hypothetical protein